MGHILENAPNNVASVLRPGQGAHQNFMVQPGQQVQSVYPAIHDSSDSGPAAHGTVSWSQLEEANSSALFPTWNNWSTAPAAHVEPAPAETPVLWTEPGWNDDSENGTDSDTVSSLGETAYQLPPGCDDFDTAAQEVFWQYQRAKAKWRNLMNKPTRRARRFIRRKGKGKGRSRLHSRKGKGQRINWTFPGRV